MYDAEARGMEKEWKKLSRDANGYHGNFDIVSHNRKLNSNLWGYFTAEVLIW